MSTATATICPAETPQSAAALADIPSILLRGISWDTYQSLRRPEENNHLRMTYDQGELEIMSPLRKHGKIATLLDRMIYEWAKLQHIKIESGRDMTCDREDLEKGLEPDLCYWIAQEAAVRGKDQIDLTRDPPPDLALEVEVSRSSLPNLPIYETLRVGEIWRWSGTLEILQLSDSGGYVAAAESRALPGFPVQLAANFLQDRDSDDETTLMVRFIEGISTM